MFCNRWIKMLGALVLALGLNACHVGRFFVWNFADINDNRKFAARPIETSNTPFLFINGDTTSLRLPKSILHKGKEISFEAFLEQTKTVGFMVIRNDSILLETYRRGYAAESEIPSFSMAKSVVSALVGIAVGEGHIRSVHDPITRYLPELDSAKFGNITIEHVLQMRSGIRYNESYINPFGHVAKHYYGRNLAKYIRQLDIERAPNERFQYISVNTQLLGFIVERATGKKLEKYLEEKLWKPLGMEFAATWSIDSKQHQNAKAFCCLNARMRDFAKFGRLYLRGGDWQGKQLVPAEWVRASTQGLAENRFIYSYQWWHTAERDANASRWQPTGDFYAEGILGQFVYVYPKKNIIIVRLGKGYGGADWSGLFLAMARAN